MLKALAAWMIAAALVYAPAARADAVEGTAVMVSVVTIGTVGGLATSISTLVHALDRRTFEGPWVVASMFTSAVCGTVAISFIASGDAGSGGWGVVGTMFYLGLTAVPTYWVIKSALADVDPGERFDADIMPAPEDDPEAALNRRPLPSSSSAYTFTWSF
jgi:hypothetical protein